MSLVKRQEALLEEFSWMLDWKEKYHHIVDLGKKLPPFPDEYRKEEFKVSGCVSQVWLYPFMEGEKLHFHADSDSLFVKGLLALVLSLYGGLPAKEITLSEKDFIKKLGVTENISPSRVNGLGALLEKIYSIAQSMEKP